MTTYRYTASDLLEGPPFHYHYSPFEGVELLRAWRSDRARHLAALGPDVTVPDVPAPTAGNGGVPPAGNTMDMLRHAAFGEQPPPAWLDEFIRKFEVFKRLRAAYGPDLKPTTQEYAPLQAYTFLACALARRPDAPGRLRTLNALLKLNDVLCSSPRLRECPPDARAAAACALRREVELVDALLAAKGVTP